MNSAQSDQFECVCLGRDWLPGAPALHRSRGIKPFLRDAYLRASYFGMRGDSARITAAPRSVIVCTGGNLGGAVISLPLIKAVRARFPDSHLAVLSNTPVGAELVHFAQLGDSHHVLQSFPHSDIRGFALAVKKLAALHALQPEVLIANFDSHVDHMLAPLRIPLRVGHVGTRATGGGALNWQHYNVPVAVSTGDNWLESYQRLGQAVGAPSLEEPAIEIPESLRREALQVLRSLGLRGGERAFAVQAGVWSSHAWKQWPLERLAQACRELSRERSLRPVVLGSAGQRPAVAKLKSLAPEIEFLDLVGDTSVAEVAALLAVCDATIANDSGLMHLSAAVGTPTVAIYGMTDPAITWCYRGNEAHRVIRRNDCRPCFALDERIVERCEKKACLTTIPASAVVEAVRTVLDRAAGATSAATHA